jgi:hypothetical protein
MSCVLPKTGSEETIIVKLSKYDIQTTQALVQARWGEDFKMYLEEVRVK